MRKKWMYIGIGLLTLVVVVGSYVYTPVSTMIQDFNDERDTQDILSLMKDNWYWLISSPDYQADVMLRERTPSHKQPEYFGKLKIKVLRKETNLVGFVTYYKKSEYQGHIFILAVDKKYRGKGYAKLLTSYAMDDLKKMGAEWAQLVTREANTGARALYKKLGFQEYFIDDEGFAHFRKML